MASAYPTGLDNFSISHVSGETISEATDNNQADALNKIEAELGINPSGGAATVVSRLNTIETTTVVLEELVFSTTINKVINATIAMPLFVAKFPCRIQGCSIVTYGTTVGASDASYWTVDLRRMRDAAASTPVIATKNTRTTGGEAMTSRTAWHFTGVFNTTNHFMDPSFDQFLDIVFTKTGTPNDLNDLAVTIRYEPA